MSTLPPSPTGPLSESPPPPRRRRGAQPGNRNALKHGYYAGRFKRTDLNAYRTYRFAGVTEEIALLRLFIRRTIDNGVEDPHFTQSICLLRVISLATISLDRLIKTQAHLIDGEDDISVAIREVFEELTGDHAPANPPPPPCPQYSPASPSAFPQNGTARQSGMDTQNENEPEDPTGPFQAYSLTYDKDPDDTNP
jgi:hypothetical protein